MRSLRMVGIAARSAAVGKFPRFGALDVPPAEAGTSNEGDTLAIYVFELRW
jgi:hypothetical protein